MDTNTPFDIDEAIAWLRAADTPLLRKITAAAWLNEEGWDSVAVGRRIQQSPSTVRHWSRLLHKLAPAVLERLDRPIHDVSMGHLKAIATLPANAQLSL